MSCGPKKRRLFGSRLSQTFALCSLPGLHMFCARIVRWFWAKLFPASFTSRAGPGTDSRARVCACFDAFPRFSRRLFSFLPLDALTMPVYGDCKLKFTQAELTTRKICQTQTRRLFYVKINARKTVGQLTVGSPVSPESSPRCTEPALLLYHYHYRSYHYKT